MACNCHKCGDSFVKLNKLPNFVVPGSSNSHKQDKVASADEVIRSIFAMLSAGSARPDYEASIIKKLGLKDPDLFDVDVSDEFISKVAQRVLESFEGKIAIVKNKCYKVGEDIELLVITPKKPESADPAVDQLTEDMKDGIIEDLKGVIEVIDIKPKSC